jgi:hypothetical protein
MAETESSDTAPTARQTGRRLSPAQLAAVVEAAYIPDAVRT